MLKTARASLAYTKLDFQPLKTEINQEPRSVSRNRGITWPSWTSPDISIEPLQIINFDKSYKEAFEREPENKKSSMSNAIDKWRILGPVTLKMIVDNSLVPIDYSVPLTLSQYDTGIIG